MLPTNNYNKCRSIFASILKGSTTLPSRTLFISVRSNIKFRTSFRNCVYKGLLGREWKETDGDEWNVMWCEKEQVDWVFEKHRLIPQAKVNHFRGWTELCRKDMLSKNLKKYKRGLEKQGNNTESNEYDFLPPTFLMPSEYVIFY